MSYSIRTRLAVEKITSSTSGWFVARVYLEVITRVPRTNLHLIDKAFPVADGSRAWNSLQTGVRSCVTKTTFCKHLKTHLFRVSYGHVS